ncbi:MAG: hypothetical protein IJQ02_03445 [Oscillospiraceae bacterium]|nr:hypothetical protein [Oscillospiraceae bacterium]
MKRVLCLLLCAILSVLCTAGCGRSATAVPTAVPAADSTGSNEQSTNGEAVLAGEGLTPAFPVNDNNRVFYEIFVGSFSDSDGDGVGDLRGILNRLDYLNDGDPDSGLSLGIEGIWLTPVFQSPSYHKYDVTDYYTIDPAFGSTEDLEALIAACHERGVKLILDLPINHTGSQNKWFVQFRDAHIRGDTADPFYDFYSWCYADNQPAGRTWNEISGTQEMVECNFSPDMPELNYESESVRNELLNIARFYLEKGVDGFRFDAAKYLYLNDHTANMRFWSWYLEELRRIKPDLYAVAEVWDTDSVTEQYYPAVNCFNFTVSQAEGTIARAAKGGSVSRYTDYVENYLQTIRSLRDDAAFVPFIANHDTDRAAGFLPVSSGAMQMAANLYLLSPGSPFIYYGEELGMKGSRGGANTDANRRLAMLWGDGDTVQDPEGADFDASRQVAETVSDQIADGGSLYNYYKALLMIRRANPEIARGDYRSLSFGDSKLGGFVSTWEGSSVCVLHNTTGDAITVDLGSAGAADFTEIRAVIGQGTAELDGSSITIDAQTSVILK